jgi:S-(hydroxymethyl)glutathione dehydrogenase/alcohol dehydrogenase
MKAAVLNQSPGDLDIEDVSVADPSPREVRLRVANAGLCHSDLHFMDGLWRTSLPAVMGHESAGVVEAVGSDVTYVEPGDHIITCLSVFCGHCAECLTGHPNRCQNYKAVSRSRDMPPRLTNAHGDRLAQFAQLAGFAEEMLVHENAVVKIRPDMPLDRACLIGCGVTTGLGAVFKTARIEPGSTVCVIGCGGIGLSAVQGARIAGANRIVAVDVSDHKLEIARTMGATDTVNATSVDNPVEAVRDLTQGGVEYSFEAIGLKQTVEQAFDVTRLGGTAVVIGMIPQDQKVELAGWPFFMLEKTLKGSMMGSNAFRVDMPRYVDMYLDGRLMLDEMISATLTLEDINDGYDALRKGEVARQVIAFD